MACGAGLVVFVGCASAHCLPDRVLKHTLHSLRRGGVELFGELALEDLASGGAGELLDDDDLAGDLPLDEALVAAEVSNLVGFDLDVFLEDDKGDDDFAAGGILLS